MRGSACGLRKETGVSFPPPSANGRHCHASSVVGTTEGARREVANTVAKGGGPGTFPDPQTSNAGEDLTSEACRSRRTEIGEGSPAMGSKAIASLGRLGITRGSTGSHQEGGGMLWSSQFANAVFVRVSAVVGFGGGLLVLFKWLALGARKKGTVKGRESGKRTSVCREVSGKRKEVSTGQRGRRSRRW